MQARRTVLLAVWAALSAASLFLEIGCAKRRTAYDELYARLTEEPASLDWSVLEGRSIVIDPGHGGYFRGAVGADSLDEADVNLGVALNLWGLLVEAGAEVTLTRSADRDFLPEGSLELRDDLDGRMQRANDREADVFVSIHHNANLPVDRAVNRIEVYYDGADPGSSLDLAADVRLHLARNLGITDAEITPGNYYVLRNSRARASILGEASYLSHPGVEERLKLAEKQRLEAEAYFLGLITYFSRGIPSIERLSPPRDTIAAPEAIVFRVEGSGGIAVDPASAVVTIGESEAQSFYDPATGTLRCALESDIPNGTYTIGAAIRSVGGGRARCVPFALTVHRPARFVLPLPSGAAPGGGISCRVRVLDELGRPVADGTPITVTALAGGPALQGAAERGVFSYNTTPESAAGAFRVETYGFVDTVRFDPGVGERAVAIVVVDAATGAPVPFPTLILRDGRAVRGERRGWLLLRPEERREDVVVTAAGYRPAQLAPPGNGEREERADGDIVRLDPVFGGILHGVRIAVDPGGGGSEDGGTGPRKQRGASINLDVARRLGEMVEGAGGRALLTRRGEETIGEEERIYRINSGGAGLAVGIHHDGGVADGVCRVTHYPGSERGDALACSLAAALDELPPCRGFGVLESASPLLRQTSCPACEIHAASIEDEIAESALSHPLYARLAAERIFSALLRHLGGADRRWLSRTVRVLCGGTPVVRAAVCIDHALTMITDDGGYARFTCIDAGAHAVTIETPDARRRELRFIDIAEDGPNLLTLELTPERRAEP